MLSVATVYTCYEAMVIGGPEDLSACCMRVDDATADSRLFGQLYLGSSLLFTLLRLLLEGMFFRRVIRNLLVF